jgi:hypothetical protein
MAGGTLKAFGAILLILGLLGLVGGLVAAAVGYTQETGNRDKGVFYDKDEGDVNQALLAGGAVAAGVGLVLAILGAILLAIGGARGRRALERAIAARPPGAAAAPPTVTQQATAPAKERGPGAAIVAVLVGALLFGVVLVLALGGFDDVVGTVGGSPNKEAAPPYSKSFNGTVGGFAAMGRTANAQGDNSGDFTPTTGASCLAVLEWTPSDTGANTLYLQISVGGNAIAQGSGGPGLALPFPRVAGPAAHHYAVFPADDPSVVAMQAFTLTVSCGAP